MVIQQINWGSGEYEQMIELRITALLQPIGVPASYIDREKEKDDLFIAAFDMDQMTGCCILTPLSGWLVQLRQMAVQPHHQGKGMGAAILAFAEELARSRKYTT